MLTFLYSTMNAGKTANLIMKAHACSSRGVGYCVLVPSISTERDDKTSTTYGYQVYSRTGFSCEAIPVSTQDDLYSIVMRVPHNCHVVFVDEAQFLTADQVIQLSSLADQHNIDVYAYGLRTDFKGNLFEGSNRLFAWADKFEEIDTYAKAPKGAKAMFNIKVDDQGNRIYEGDSISVGFGYEPVSRIEFDLKNNWHK